MANIKKSLSKSGLSPQSKIYRNEPKTGSFFQLTISCQSCYMLVERNSVGVNPSVGGNFRELMPYCILTLNPSPTLGSYRTNFSSSRDIMSSRHSIYNKTVLNLANENHWVILRSCGTEWAAQRKTKIIKWRRNLNYPPLFSAVSASFASSVLF